MMDAEQWRQVDALLQFVLALPPQDRDVFLRHACERDEALEREVRSLLLSEQQAGNFLESPAIAVAAQVLVSQQKKEQPFGSQLLPGQTLSRFRIIGMLGQGGMGIVYEAEDQKLGRPVALKLLPGAARQDPVALERFWREARAASSLNHGGICTIYELDDSDDQPFIVMELLQGQSLDKIGKLDRGQRRLPMLYAKLLDFGIQVADALDAAHRKGIIHRDIKPSNLFLSPSGQAKILDFGLAKLEEDYTRTGGAMHKTASKNMQEPDRLLTSPGLAIGTIAYMSPEQARGENLDARSDVFSLGVVLYELATGLHPFAGATTAITFDRILNLPPVSPIALNPELPPEFEETLNKTLEKDREMRLQSAAELRADLKRLQRRISGTSAAWAVARASATGTGTVAIVRKRSRALPVFLMAMLLLTAGFGAWQMWPRPAPFSSLSVSQITNLGTVEDIALSADGKFLAEVKNDAGQRTVWLRNIPTNTATQILSAFPQEYVGLNFSPDANYLYFTRADPDHNAVRALYAMPVFGGKPRQLINDVNSAPSFSPDGHHFTYLRWTPNRSDQYSEIHIADKDGGSDQAVYVSPNLSRAPAWSPQGDEIAWIESGGRTPPVIKSLNIGSRKLRSLSQPAGILFDPVPVPARCDLVWLPDGRHLLVLYARPLTDRAQVGVVEIASGNFSPLTNDVNAYSQLAVSGDGKTLATVMTNVDSGLAYYHGGGGAMMGRTPLRITPSSLTWLDEDHLLFITHGLGISKLERTSGSLQPIDTGTLDAGVYITTCPNGQVVFTADAKQGGPHSLFRMHGDGIGVTQLTNIDSVRAPFCTPDSQKIYFTIRDKIQMSSLALWSVPLSGGTPRKELDLQGQGSVALSRDARFAEVFLPKDTVWYTVIRDLVTQQTVHHLPLDSKAAIRNSYPGFSPDAKAIVVGATDQGGNTLLYQPIDGSPAHLLTEPTAETLTAFAWSPSGSKLGVLQVRKSSDVVLITDLTGKQPR